MPDVCFVKIGCTCVEDDTHFEVRSIVTGNELYYLVTLLYCYWAGISATHSSTVLGVLPLDSELVLLVCT